MKKLFFYAYVYCLIILPAVVMLANGLHIALINQTDTFQDDDRLISETSLQSQAFQHLDFTLRHLYQPVTSITNERQTHKETIDSGTCSVAFCFGSNYDYPQVSGTVAAFLLVLLFPFHGFW